jgi:hypothetical protein
MICCRMGPITLLAAYRSDLSLSVVERLNKWPKANRSEHAGSKSAAAT